MSQATDTAYQYGVIEYRRDQAKRDGESYDHYNRQLKRLWEKLWTIAGHESSDYWGGALAKCRKAGLTDAGRAALGEGEG